MAVGVAILLLAFCGVNGIEWPKQTSLKALPSYDYIIVGGGTAGSIVARRLAEDKKCSVLVLEAGGNPPDDALLPAKFPELPTTEVDYDFYSNFDSYAAGSQGNYTKITAGKMLGGSASLGHFIHSRGTPINYDDWAKIAGDDSWKYDEVLPYFIKSEKTIDDDIIKAYPQYHGTEGLMGLTRQTHDEELADYLASYAEVGNPSVLDLNADVFLGYTQPQLRIADGLRQTPAYTYLNPIKDYSNLYVSKNTIVSRLIFENTTAVAVEAIYKGKTYTLKANKEIILCAGVFNTPQILMLSGIGPKKHLESLHINVLSDLAVGDNLADQKAITIVYKTKSYKNCTPDPDQLTPDMNKLPFPAMMGSVAVNKIDKYPEYQTYSLLFAHDTPTLTSACSSVFGYRDEICNRWQEQVTCHDALFTLVSIMQPKSRGCIRLKSTDPFDDPEITTGYLIDEKDVENMVRYVKDFIKVGDSSFFKEINAELVGLDLPECADKKVGSDEFWKHYILSKTVSPYHFVGSCPMGSVVDGKLKVKGFKKLRIVDGSVIPIHPHGAPHAAVVMIAEKGADMIKADS